VALRSDLKLSEVALVEIAERELVAPEAADLVAPERSDPESSELESSDPEVSEREELDLKAADPEVLEREVSELEMSERETSVRQTDEGGQTVGNVAEMRVIIGDIEADESEVVARAPQPRPEELRILEALLFAAEEPLDEKALAARLPAGVNVRGLLEKLQQEYASRGVNLVRVAGKWSLRTAGDLAWLLTRESVVSKKLSRAAIETLAIVAYHQPVTRAEIEEIRGVTTSKGTLDVLLETGWVRLRGRRKAPGRPVTYGTTEAFLSHFGLDVLADLPGIEELKGSGLIDQALPAGFTVPMPSDDPSLREDEDPLEEEAGAIDLSLAPPAEQTDE
jgi:segregation and condensation protein B